jgi:hypothetical protein
MNVERRYVLSAKVQNANMQSLVPKYWHLSIYEKY